CYLMFFLISSHVVFGILKFFSFYRNQERKKASEKRDLRKKGDTQKDCDRSHESELTALQALVLRANWRCTALAKGGQRRRTLEINESEDGAQGWSSQPYTEFSIQCVGINVPSLSSHVWFELNVCVLLLERGIHLRGYSRYFAQDIQNSCFDNLEYWIKSLVNNKTYVERYNIGNYDVITY
ncbi:hypothetical protein ACJX0J_010529, partial [Zea mays]